VIDPESDSFGSRRNITKVSITKVKSDEFFGLEGMVFV